MNSAMTFLREHRQHDALGSNGRPEEWSCALLTPRFRASRHVVFLIFSRRSSRPVLVAKMPRLPGDDRLIAREAANLRAAEACVEEESGSIPRVVAFDESATHPVLLETALCGRPLNPAAMRRHRRQYCRKVVDWLIDFQRRGRTPAENDPDWYERLVERPLQRAAQRLRMEGEELALLERTRAIGSLLKEQELPLAFEHGDLSDPNLLLLGDGSVGVLDWELARPKGLPGCDLFFFLTYAATAGCSAVRGPLDRFRETFFKYRISTQTIVRRYTAGLELDPAVMKPLFVLTWARAVATLTERLEGANGRLSEESVRWIRAQRSFEYWKFAVENFELLEVE